MTAITLEAIEEKQSELAALIEKFKADQPTRVSIPAIQIDLKPGERYAGTVLDADGRVLHHLVLMPGKGEELDWEQAKAWAKEAGGDLPTRQEQALLFANCKSHLAPEWHWSSEAHETNASWAWGCSFNDGSQGSISRSAELSAVAVRRIL